MIGGNVDLEPAERAPSALEPDESSGSAVLPGNAKSSWNGSRGR